MSNEKANKSVILARVGQSVQQQVEFTLKLKSDSIDNIII